MLTVTIRRIGPGSGAITLPSPVMKMCDWQINDVLHLEVVNKQVILTRLETEVGVKID
jgi:antitoxin component of MazEF toxin-antitoxin module